MSSRRSIRRNHEDMENLSDSELRHRLHEKGYPNIPVTETTRKILLTKLNNETQSPDSTSRLNASKSKARRTETSARSSGDPSRNSRKPRYGNVLEYILTEQYDPKEYFNQCGFNRNGSSPKRSYASHLSMEQSDEDSDFANSNANANNSWRNNSNNSNYSSLSYELDRNSNAHYGLVNRLLSLRDKTIKKTEKPTTSGSYAPYRSSSSRYSSNINYNANNYSHLHNTSMSHRLVQKAHRLLEFLAPRSLYHKICSWTKMDMCIPYTLITLFVVFLLVLCFMYVKKSFPLSNLVEDRSNMKLLSCQPNEENLKYGDLSSSKICLGEDLIPATITLKHDLFRLLYERAKHVQCDQPLEPITVGLGELIKAHAPQVNEVVSADGLLVRKLQALEYLIHHNPQWNITIANNEGLVASFLHLDKYRLPRVNEWIFVLMRRDYPLMCVVYRKVHRFFAIIGTGALVGGLVLMLYCGYDYAKRMIRKRMADIDKFVQEITNELMLQAAKSNNDPEERKVILNHLRDKLIPLHKRNKLWPFWDAAVKILTNTDSRIQCGVVLHNGEEFATMSWIEKIDPATADNCLKTKKWQSPAFDNMNAVPSPPTPCLKIRHMFDTSEVGNPRLKQMIEEAILEKVGPNCSITDIQLDKESCCVYIRCVANKDAGTVHSLINGWWFDNRLLSVKFVRLQRYLTRFPDDSPPSFPSFMGAHNTSGKENEEN